MASAPNIYLERYAYPRRYLDYQPHKGTNLIVVLPCHDEPALIESLVALNECGHPGPVEVIVVINASETAPQEISERNKVSYDNALYWTGGIQKSNINFHFILDNDLPKKHAGVGLARKIGMDEAVRMFELIDNPDGVILCFDADCLCEPNLLNEVNRHFETNPRSPGCSIHFEHPLEGPLEPAVYTGILFYELHLRYYVDALRYASFPYAYQTIGSSMAVRSSAYQKQGGMNRRKAGEDFYFLHKIIPLGDFGEVTTTAVYPSPRVSHRVPFGTGRAVGEWLAGEKEVHLTYHPAIFQELKVLLDQVDSFFALELLQIEKRMASLPQSVREFLVSRNFKLKIEEIKGQSSNLKSFRKRFFQWFDGFLVLKYVHFSRDNFHPNVAVEEAVDWLFNEKGIVTSQDLKEKLLRLREWDKSTGN